MIDHDEVIARVKAHAESLHIYAKVSKLHDYDMPFCLDLGEYQIRFLENMEDVIKDYLTKTYEYWKHTIDRHCEFTQKVAEKYGKDIKFYINYTDPFDDQGGAREILDYLVTIDGGEPVTVGNSYSGLTENVDYKLEAVPGYVHLHGADALENYLKQSGLL